MGLFGKKLNYSQNTVGIIKDVSAVKVNNMHLPLAEYEVNGETYRVRVPHEIAVVMEAHSQGDKSVVRANLNFGNASFNGQVTGIQGRSVQIVYDPAKPENGKVIGVL